MPTLSVDNMFYYVAAGVYSRRVKGFSNIVELSRRGCVVVLCLDHPHRLKRGGCTRNY